MEERLYWVGFSVFPGAGPMRFKQLLSYFGSAKAAWNADIKELGQAGLGTVLAEKFHIFRKDFSLEQYAQKLQGKNVSVLTLEDNEYPKLLAGINNPPFVLYTRGEVEALTSYERYIGIVGTRKITQYGIQVTRLLTQELVAAGYVIVSGLAMGVDAVAHKTTIENGGKTIAVLGCGVDCCSPRENTSLYNEILKDNGIIISEFPLGATPSKGSFPSRNRIVAGLSQAVVVTEGAADSGALITAADAFKNGRKVFAVPGPITSSLSKGPNSLLSKGAMMVTSADDILQELEGAEVQGYRGTERQRHRGAEKIKGETEEEQKILDLLQNEDLHFDDIVRKTGINSAKVGTLLSLMEMKGMVRNLDAGLFAIAV